MNKIKAIYDVVKTMKEKKEKEGILRVKVEQDGQQILKFMNEFQHTGDGHTRCKLQSEWNCDGNEGKHESTTEFKREHEQGCPFHGRFRHYRNHEHLHHGHRFKSKADVFLFFLRLLNELKAEEQGENLEFSLVLDDEVKKIKERMEGKFDKNGIAHGHPHHPLKGKLLEKIMLMEKPNILVNIIANKNKEVEKAMITIQGIYEQDGLHELNIAVEVNFIK